jgi:uncharacterized protein (TIGR04222 family)
VNPFDLPGPQFLAFYAVLALVALAAVRLGRRRPDVSGMPSRIDDPFALASLREGPDEAIRVAALSLLDRRLLKSRGGNVLAVAPEHTARRTLERALLRAFATERPGGFAFQDPGVRAAAEAIDADLARAGLLATGDALAARGRARWFVAAALVAVAATKIAIALSRGRTHVGFLVLLAGGAVLLALGLGQPARRTSKGDKAVELARRAFARLEGGAAAIVPGGATNELALAAAVFGPAVLPPLGMALLTEASLAPVTRSGSGWSWDTSWGSGSSCGSSSCGGGCGGGGCGGCGS